MRAYQILMAFALLAAPPAYADMCDNKDIKILVGSEVDAIRIGPPPVLLIDDESLNDWESVELSLTVDASGRMTCLLPQFGPAPLIPRALALARQWRFKPYLVDGKPVTVTFGHRVDIDWQSPRPTLRVPFPVIRDWSSLRMRLEMLPGYMDCIAYNVEIAGDGTLIFEGDYGAAGHVRKTKRLARAVVADLFERFRKVDFFWLHDSYTGETHHAPYGWLSIAFDGRLKRVRDEVGHEAGMPAEVDALETEIDRLADTKRYTENVRCRLPKFDKNPIKSE